MSQTVINHARTLLINRKPDNVSYGGQLGDEYYPSNYVPVMSMPTYLSSIRNMLLGANPDRVFLNYRARQYMALLHSTELLEFVLELDPRITYDVDNDDMSSDDAFGIRAPDSIHIIGNLGSPDRLGRCYHEWDLNVLNEETIQVIRRTFPQQDSVQEYTITDGMSSRIELVGSEAAFTFNEGINEVWGVAGYARPTRDLGEIQAELESAGAPYMNDLFGVGTPLGASEPFLTFRNLWFKHPELAYRVGGVLLAVIYRMEELRVDA